MKKLTALAVATILGTSFSATAMEREGSVSLMTNYMYKGFTQTDHDPAIQGTYDIQFDNGIYTGAFASNVAEGAEIDLSLGYTYSLPSFYNLSLSAGATGYIYTDEEFSENILEYNLGIGATVLAVDLSLSADYADEFTVEYMAYTATAEKELDWDLTVYAEAGYTDYNYKRDTGVDDTILHYKLGASVEMMENFELFAEYHDSDRDSFESKDHFLAGATYRF